MVVAFGDMEAMTAASFVLLTNLVHLVKLYCFIFQRTKVQNLINSINREEFKPKNSDDCNILLKDINRSKRITKSFWLMCFMVCLLFAIFPLLDKSQSEGIRLPLGGWYPFNTNESPVFQIVYVYQILATYVNGIRNISIDTFISGVIMVISGQLSLLNNEFQTINAKQQDFGHNQVEIRKLLLRNVLHYKSIITFTDDVTTLFSTCLISQFVVSVVIICMTMFQLSLVPVLSLQFLSMAMYQACMLLEIFLWCYYGNEVILKSTNLTMSAYRCGWVEFSKEFKQDLLFFMTRTQFPLKLYAGGYFTLSLDTFMAILKSSWSYFAMLNTVHSKEIV
ncbi:hypothetical protein Zmor_015680 [Zophobas morio]|uniref:Odorant receptor n=2 Tax=Zophobas morio TaxID=2755281 RepID=A0AA38MHT1_9CUCU|nr:hypothetical protein Zmor_015680 [Zophobas morio]